MLGMLSFSLLPVIAMRITSGEQTQSEIGLLLCDSIPVLLYAMAAAVITLDAGEGLLELKPAELQFVLAGPFTNSQILSYRLLTLLTGFIPLSLFFAIFALPYSGSFVGSALAILLVGSLIVLISFQYTLLKPTLSPTTLRMIRVVSLGSIALVCLESGSYFLRSDNPVSLAEISQAINGGWAARVLATPFRSFASLFNGSIGLNLALDALISVALVASVACSCYLTNSGFAELAVEGVARRRKKLERIKGGNVYGLSVGSQERKRMLPPFGWWGGIGPVAWSQLTSSLRRSGRLIPSMLFLGVVASFVLIVVIRLYPYALDKSFRDYSIPIALAGAGYLGFLVTITAQGGFSANRRLLTWYQTLPIKPVSIAIGMIAGTGSVLAAIQVALLLPAVAITTQSWAHCGALLFAGLAVDIAFATAINLVSATTGLRPMPQGTPDVFQGARAMVFMFVFAISMLPTFVFGTGGAVAGGAIFGFSWSACAIGGGISILMIQPLLWWVSGERFVQSEPQDG